MTLDIHKADPRDAVFKDPLARHVAAADEEFGTDLNFALPAENLAAPGMEFWAAWQDGQLAGFIALKRLSDVACELKSMRVLTPFQGRGIGRHLVDTVLGAARAGGYGTVFLETGRTESYAAARHVYRRAGFSETGPFADYPDVGVSLFMRLDLPAGA